MKFTTFTGKLFDPLAATVADIDIRDIAHALAQTCRFNGHVSRFYSVAQHSVTVSEMVEGQAREFALAALLHDASEAYIADMSRPVKYQPEMAGYRAAEQRLQCVIYERFGFAPVVAQTMAETLPRAIEVADDRLLAAEFRDLIPNAPFIWSQRAENYPYIRPMMPVEAELAFIRRFVALTDGAV